jgi:hypothetical protein
MLDIRHVSGGQGEAWCASLRTVRRLLSHRIQGDDVEIYSRRGLQSPRQFLVEEGASATPEENLGKGILASAQGQGTDLDRRIHRIEISGS